MGFHFPSFKNGFVRFSSSDIEQAQDVVRRIGTAIIGGDFTGKDRGHDAIDIQNSRTGSDQVAGGESAICFGALNKATGARSMAVGVQNWATATEAFALGAASSALGQGSAAIGQLCNARAEGQNKICLTKKALPIADSILSDFILD